MLLLKQLFVLVILVSVIFAKIYPLEEYDSATVESSPNPKEVYVQSVTYGGNGCPQGSVGTSIANDRKSFTLIFDSFVASTGPNVPVLERKKSCAVNVNLRFPGGDFTNDATFDVRGYTSIPSGSFAKYSSSSIPSLALKVLQHNLVKNEGGPMSRDYIVNHKMRVSNKNYQECSRVLPLRVDFNIELSTVGVSSQKTIDSIDFKLVPVSSAPSDENC